MNINYFTRIGKQGRFCREEKKRLVPVTERALLYICLLHICNVEQ